MRYLQENGVRYEYAFGTLQKTKENWINLLFQKISCVLANYSKIIKNVSIKWFIFFLSRYKPEKITLLNTMTHNKGEGGYFIHFRVIKFL